MQRSPYGTSLPGAGTVHHINRVGLSVFPAVSAIPPIATELLDYGNTPRAQRPHRTGSFKSANSAKTAHVSECEGKSQKLTSHARLIKAIRDGVENSLPEILANFRGPVSIGGEYHGNLPQVGLSNQQQLTVAVLAVTKFHFCCIALTCKAYFLQFLNFMSGGALVSQHGAWATSRHHSCHSRSSQTGSF